MAYLTPEPDDELQDFAIDLSIRELGKKGHCDAHLYEVVYCGRLFSTSFRYFGGLLERARVADSLQLSTIARLLDSEDRWGHRATVDIRLRFQRLLAQRLGESKDPVLKRAAAVAMGPAVPTRLLSPELDWIRELVESVPSQLMAWWYPHIYGHSAQLTGKRRSRLRVDEFSLPWLLKALRHPRLEFFATSILQRASRLRVPEEYHEELRSQYVRARTSRPWCYFGQRTGNWKRADWARFLAKHTDHRVLTALCLQSPVNWFEVRAVPDHDWCVPEVGSSSNFRQLLHSVGAEGLAVYRLVDEQPSWQGMVGKSWIGPPLKEQEYFRSDVVKVAPLSPLRQLPQPTPETDSPVVIGAVGHLVLSVEHGIGMFFFRPLRDENENSPTGPFTESDLSVAQAWRDRCYSKVRT